MQCFSLLECHAGQATDVSMVEQVSICVCYVRIKGEELEVCEEFLGFSVPSTDAEKITSTIVSFMKDCGLNMSRLVGKGFDGASNMSGHNYIWGFSKATAALPKGQVFHSLS